MSHHRIIIIKVDENCNTWTCRNDKANIPIREKNKVFLKIEFIVEKENKNLKDCTKFSMTGFTMYSSNYYSPFLTHLLLD